MIGPAQAARARDMAIRQRVGLIVEAMDEMVRSPAEYAAPFVLDVTALAMKHGVDPFSYPEVLLAIEEARKAGWRAHSQRNGDLCSIILTDPEDMEAQARKEGLR